MSEQARRRRRAARRGFVIVANRLPVRRIREADGDRWVTSPGGLISALTPVMTDFRDSAWVGWTGAVGPVPEPFTHDGIDLHPVELSRADLQLYYEGFSNGTLWPLYHDGVEVPEYHRTWWTAYVAVNQRFADAAAEVAKPNGQVWVQDYQLQLVPAMLRKARPDLRIGWFNHIPFPPRELFVRMPWRLEVIEGLLGADVIGFQTPDDAANFRRAARSISQAGAGPGRDRLMVDNRPVLVSAYPVGIDAQGLVERASAPDVDDKVTELRQALGDPECVMLGVDRLDYTKGIELRLRAYRELLDEDRLPEGTVMIQIAEPSRAAVAGYAEIRAQVEQLVGDINGNFGAMGRPVVHYLHQAQTPEEIAIMYRAADVMVVTPFRDGMNLVAKEYVASRIGDDGVLVLSEFAGASIELRQAMLVNPHDITTLKNTLEAAVRLPRAEQTRTMRAMRRTVLRYDASHWARSFFEDLAAA